MSNRGWRGAIALSAFLAISCFSQGVRSTLVGRVTDESGAVIPKTKVAVTNVGTNEVRSAETNDNGEFVIPQLAPGEYMLAAEHEGFRKEARKGIVLETGQQARLDVVMRVGSIAEQVEVTAAAPLLSSENASVGNVVDQKKVVELPLNGRDYLQLAQLQPNVFAPASGSNLGFRGGFNVAGNSEISNQYLLDGVDNNDETTNQPLHRPVLDAVREFRVLTGTYSAEYGRQAGGQVIVTTRSGTNQFHGAAWEFHRNAPLDARSFFAPFKPPFHRNQYGLVLGGPIRREKTFFFVGWENQNRGQQEAKVASVPINAFKQGDFSSIAPLRNPFDGNRPFTGNKIPESLWSKQGAGLLALYPSPTRPGASNNIAAASPGRFNLDQFSVRVDHHFGTKDEVYAVYEFADSQEFYPLSNPLCSARDVPGWGCDELQRTQHAVTVWTHIFTPSVINEARVGYTRFGFYRLQQDRDADIVNRLGIGGLTDAGKTPFNNGSPQISLSNFVTIGGPTNLPQGRHDNTYNYVENLTFIRGSHTMKAGFDIRRFLFNSFFTSFGRGAFTFDGTFTGDPVADLLLGLPRQADRNLGEPFHNAMTFASGMYWQDDWKISPRLTLNLGVRYDLDLPLVERVDKVASFDPRTNTLRVAGGREAYIDPASGLLLIRPRADVGRRLWETDKNNIAPRVGLAWRPFTDSRTVVRAGFGTFYNHQIVGNGLTPLSRNSPFRLRQTSGPFQATDRPNLSNAFAVGVPSAVVPGIQEDFRTAYTNQWSFGIQRELMQNFVLDASYLGSQSHKLPIAWNINQAFLGSGSVASRRPYQGFGNITGGFISSIGNANFNALQVRAERRFSKGFSFVSSYTFSRAIDDGDGISAASDVGTAAQNARFLRAERGLSAYDVTHRWVLSYVWDLPFHSASKAANAIISGWQLTGILTMQGGRPFTVLAGRDDSNTGGGADRPNVLGDWHLDNPTPDRWFNTCTLLATGARKFCLPGDNPVWQQVSNGFGNEGRNALRGPTLKNFDLGLHRDFRVTERFLVQFRAEAFNIANHPNFNLPEFRVSQNAFGTISGTAFPFQTGAQRQIQFAAKVVF